MRRAVWGIVAAAVLTATAAAGFALGDRLLARREPQRCRPPAADDDMVAVPAGRFAYGDTRLPEEGPVRPRAVAGFWIDRHEVTNAQFAAFVAATGHVTTAERALDPRDHPGLRAADLVPGGMVFAMPGDVTGLHDPGQWWRFVPGANWRHPGGPGTSIAGRDDFPVTMVTIADARAYAAWKGHRLPSEVEWEWAARGGDPRAETDHEPPGPTKANSWQGIFPVNNTAADGFLGLSPVGCFEANGFGLQDMIGNVWELTADRWRPSHDDDGNDDGYVAVAQTRGGVERYVIKGGSFLCAPNFCARYRPGARQPQEADLGVSHVGFRTVRDTPSSSARP